MEILVWDLVGAVVVISVEVGAAAVVIAAVGAVLIAEQAGTSAIWMIWTKFARGTA